LLPTRPGKAVQLELKTTTVAGAGLHDVSVDLGQLWEYRQRPLGAPTTLHLEELWIKNVTITTGLVDDTTVPLLLQLVRSGKIADEMYGTHDFALHDMMAAYDTFAEAGKHNALKVVIRR
jgi:threonine dehydrogenase-like Zn-dependent dehydrogenase